MKMLNIGTIIPFFLLIFIVGCAPLPVDDPGIATVPVINSTSIPTTTDTPIMELTQTSIPTQEVVAMPDAIVADVLSVNVTGQVNDYQFNVQVSSPDTGCDQYADWWEVLSKDGGLLYRRVLLHSHVSEQPFTRSGGPVAVDEDAMVIVRAHMNNSGYGGAALQGSVSGGFESVQLESDFAAEVESLEPLPGDCAF